MEKSDLQAYFLELDGELDRLSSTRANNFVSEEFPNYPHIGSYIDPRLLVNRDYFYSQLDERLEKFSFDPLFSFEMDQIKYSTNILHPDCNCYRRSKVKKRPIKTTSHRDRIIYGGWNHYLSRKHKKWIEKNDLKNSISAYIPKTGKFNADYAKLAFDYIQGRDEYSAIALDVKSFFDNIPHRNLKNNLIQLLDDGDNLSQTNYKLFKANTKYTYIELEELKQNLSKFDRGNGMYISRKYENWEKLRRLKLIQKNNKSGIPQGLPCSGVLANIAMMNVDLFMKNNADLVSGIYLRYADDIFIAAPNKKSVEALSIKCQSKLKELDLPIAHKKTEIFDYNESMDSHPTISYLGINCNGSNVSVRQNGVNKFYQRTSQFIYSYVLTCKSRGISPSRKKIKGIFSHSGDNNYYSYLRRVSKVFEQDKRYKVKGIKGVLKNHVAWIDKIFDDAIKKKPSLKASKYAYKSKCSCPLKKDG